MSKLFFIKKTDLKMEKTQGTALQASSEQILAENIKKSEDIVIIAFYHFFDFPDFEERRNEIKQFCDEHNLKGTILVAHEGINSTISGTRNNINALIDYLKSDPRMKNLQWKESFWNDKPFQKMKVRLKKEIVRLAVEDLDSENRGKYISPDDWDDFISRDDVINIDTRNEYETRIGTFEGSVDPDTKNFRDFPAWAKNWAQDKDKDNLKIAMFCTGGIRCEKSTAYMKKLGFKDVYHLDGGILQYFEDTKNKNGKWKGECFVFDDRAAVDASLKPTGELRCKKCGDPVSADDLKHGPKGKIWCGSCVESKNRE